MNWELLETDNDLADMCEDAKGRTMVAVDTEFMRRNTFYPQAALLQLCFADTAWLIDPLTIEDPSPLIELFENTNIVKVLHSSSEDLEVFQQWLGVLPQPLFDTQRAAAMLGMGFGLGYRALVMEMEGVDLPKGETRSDWLQRPLTDSQCDYAALDVLHLLPAATTLYQKIVEQEKLDWLLSDGEYALQSLASGADGYHRKIKSAWKLDSSSLGILAAVCEWRERTARLKDKPRGWIIDDNACLEIAREIPQTMSELSGLEGMVPQLLRRYGDEILSTIKEQCALPADAMPVPLGRPLDAEQRNQVKRLKQSVKRIAAELIMDPEVLLSGKDFELLVREAAGEIIDIPVTWLGWRNAVVISPLRSKLSGTEA